MSSKEILLVYGLPCSGKSSFVRSLTNYHAIAIDDFIRGKVEDPGISDFVALSHELVGDVAREVMATVAEHIVIEMGCLITKEATAELEAFLRSNNLGFKNIGLTANDDELIRRIELRNRNIELGKDTSIKIDGPDYLTRFVEVFENNQPNDPRYIDTTSMAASLSDIKTKEN